jgi:hypothetical protein
MHAMIAGESLRIAHFDAAGLPNVSMDAKMKRSINNEQTQHYQLDLMKESKDQSHVTSLSTLPKIEDAIILSKAPVDSTLDSKVRINQYIDSEWLSRI